MWVGEECLSTSISVCFRYWAVLLITDSRRIGSVSPGRTEHKDRKMKVVKDFVLPSEAAVVNVLPENSHVKSNCITN